MADMADNPMADLGGVVVSPNTDQDNPLADLGGVVVSRSKAPAPTPQEDNPLADLGGVVMKRPRTLTIAQDPSVMVLPPTKLGREVAPVQKPKFQTQDTSEGKVVLVNPSFDSLLSPDDLSKLNEITAQFGLTRLQNTLPTPNKTTQAISEIPHIASKYDIKKPSDWWSTQAAPSVQAKKVLEFVQTPLFSYLPEDVKHRMAYDLDIIQHPGRRSGGAAAGVLHGLGGLALAFTSPVGVATLGIGSLPAQTRRAVSLAFAADMTSHTPELATAIGEEMGKPESERDNEKLAMLLTEGAGNTIMAVLAGAHGLSPSPKPPMSALEKVDFIQQNLPKLLQKRPSIDQAAEFIYQAVARKQALDKVSKDLGMRLSMDDVTPETSAGIQNIIKESELASEALAKRAKEADEMFTKNEWELWRAEQQLKKQGASNATDPIQQQGRVSGESQGTPEVGNEIKTGSFSDLIPGAKGQPAEARPVNVQTPANAQGDAQGAVAAVAKEIGFTFDGVQQLGANKVMAFTRRDAPDGDPTKRTTFYVPANATPDVIRERAQQKLADFKNAAQPSSTQNPTEQTASPPTEPNTPVVGEQTGAVKAAPSILNVETSEGKKAGFPDDAPSDGITWHKMTVPGSRLYFEQNDKTIWVIGVETEPTFRNQGKATQLLTAIDEYAKQTGKKIEHGTYTEDGEKFLKHVNERIKSSSQPPSSQKVSSQETAKPGATELTKLVKADVKSDPRLDEPGITRKSIPNRLILQMRDLQSRPIGEIDVPATGDPLTDSKTAGAMIRKQAATPGVSLRESAVTSTGPKGMAIYRYAISPNGIVWTTAQQLVDARASRNKPTPKPVVRGSSLQDVLQGAARSQSKKSDAVQRALDKVTPPETSTVNSPEQFTLLEVDKNKPLDAQIIQLRKLLVQAESGGNSDRITAIENRLRELETQKLKAAGGTPSKPEPTPEETSGQRRAAANIAERQAQSKTLTASNVETDANVKGAQQAKPLGTGSEFSGKVAREQKKFLLDAIDQAIEEAPDSIPATVEDADYRIVEGLSHYIANDTKETFEARRADQLPPLFEKYNVPSVSKEYVAPESLEKGTPVVPHEPAAAYSVDSRIGLLKAAISQANFEAKPKVTIEVPGDGTFDIINLKSALENFKERAQSFPTSAGGYKKPSVARATQTPAAKLGKLDDAGTLEALKPVVSDDPTRKFINYIWSDGEQTVATNGRMLTVIKHGIGGTKKLPQVFDTSGKVVKLPKDEKKYPDWRQVVPEEFKDEMKNLDTEKLFVILRQAQEATNERSNSIKVWRNKDGSLAITAGGGSLTIDVGYEHNLQDRDVSQVIAALDPVYLIAAISAARRVGDKKINLEWIDELSPVKVSSKNSYSIIMPMRLGDSSVRYVSGESPKNLVALHNTNASKLAHMIKMGGLPVPSIAITRADKGGFDSFGDITLVGNPELVTPSKETKVLNADAYSPRYPTVNYFPDQKSITAVQAMVQPTIAKMTGGHARSFSKFNLFNETPDKPTATVLKQSPEMMLAYLDATGRMPEFTKAEDLRYQQQHDQHIVRELVAYNDAEKQKFEQWVDDQIKQLGVKETEKIYKGFTPSGNRSYLPHNLETVVRIMKRGFADAEGFNYGVGSIRANAAKQFRTLKAIQDSRESIITKPEMDALKKEVDDEFSKLEEEANSYRNVKVNGFGRFDAFSDDLKAMAEGGSENWKYLREQYPDGEPFQKMREFLDKLKSMPTEYFEAKVKRAVGLHEFSGVVVPEGTSPELISQLEKRGLTVATYPKGDAEARRLAVENLATSLNVKFASASNDFAEQPTSTIQELINEKHRNITDAAGEAGQDRSLSRREAGREYEGLLKAERSAGRSNHWKGSVHDPAYLTTAHGQKLAVIAADKGLSVVFYQTTNGNTPRGAISGNIVYINSSRPETEMDSVVEHEIAHSQFRQGNARLLALADLVDVTNDTSKSYRQQYEKWIGRKITDAELKEEVVADYVAGFRQFDVDPAGAFKSEESVKLAEAYHNEDAKLPVEPVANAPPEAADARYAAGEKTQMQGKKFKVKSRTPSPVDRVAGFKAAVAMFEEAGLPTIEGPDGRVWLRDGDSWPPRHAEGMRLQQLVSEAAVEMHQLAADGAEGNDRLIGFLDSVRKMAARQQELINAGEEPAFLPETVADLLAVAQGVASEAGRILQLFDSGQRDFILKMKNVDIELRTVIGDAYGGDTVRKVLARALEGFRDIFTDKEIEDLLKRYPEYDDTTGKIIELKRKDEGGRFYSNAQNLLKPERKKKLATLEADAIVKDSVRTMLEQLKAQGIEPKKKTSQALLPIEQLLLMVEPRSESRVNKVIAEGIKEAERNAGITQAIKEANGDSEREDLQARFEAGEEPTPEQVEAGLALPLYAHWKAFRDSLAGYSPITLKLAEAVIKADFSGTKFADKAFKSKPPEPKLSLADLSKSPSDEVDRVLKGYLANLEANMDLRGASDETKQRVLAMIEKQIVAQLEKVRETVRGKNFQPPTKPGALWTAEQHIGQQINAGLFKDERMDIPEMVARVASKGVVKNLLPTVGSMVKQIFATPFYRHSELADKFSDMMAAKFGLSGAERAHFKEVFNKAFGDRLKEAGEKAMTKAWDALTPKDREVFGVKAALWQRLVNIAKTKGFDMSDALNELAKAHGWKIDPKDVAKIKDLAQRHELLATALTDDALNKIGLTRDRVATFDTTGQGLTDDERMKLEDERTMLLGATDSERKLIHRQLGTLWARVTKPFGWATHETRRNVIRALNDFSPLNLITTATFLPIQAFDVATQLASYTLATAKAHALKRYGQLPKDEQGVVPWLKEYALAVREAAKMTRSVMGSGMTAARVGLRTGRGLAVRAGGIESGIMAFDRMAMKADELIDSEDPAKQVQGAILWIVSKAGLGGRIAGSFDAFQATPSRFKEFGHSIRTYLATNTTASKLEIDSTVNEIIGDVSAELAYAASRAPEILDALGIKETKQGLRLAAWNIVLDRMILRAKRSGIPAEDVDKMVTAIEARMQTLGWNRSAGGFLGKAASVTREVQDAFTHLYFPTGGLTAFANAAANSIAMKLRFTPLGYFPKFFGKDSPLTETDIDRFQRTAEAGFGWKFGGACLLLAALGIIKVVLSWPDDAKEREKMRALGLKPGFVGIPIGDGRYYTVSLTAGPMALVSPYIAAGGAINDLNQKREKEQAKMNEEAIKRGLTPGKIPDVSMTDLMNVVGKAALQTITGTRTVSGKFGQLSDYGTLVNNKAVASWLSSMIPFAPLEQSVMRIAGVEIDPKQGSIWELVAPLPTSPNRRVNVLGDPVNSQRDITDIISTLTRGTGKIYSESDLTTGSSVAYGNLFATDYMPPAIQAGKGYSINGEYRPMTEDELARYTQLRGQYLNQELTRLGETTDVKAVQQAYQRANREALMEIGVSTPSTGASVSASASAGTTAGRISGVRRLPMARGSSLRRVSAPAARRVSVRKVRTGRSIRAYSRGPSLRPRKSLGLKRPRSLRSTLLRRVSSVRIG